MVTSTQGCLTPKGHFHIDCSGPPWLRSWQMLVLGECRGWGAEPRGRQRWDYLLTLRQLETSSRPQPPSSQPLGHFGSPTAVITTVCSLLITVFLHKLKSRVKCILSVHLQVPQNNYLDMQSLAYNREILQKHIHNVIFSTGLSWGPIIQWA